MSYSYVQNMPSPTHLSLTIDINGLANPTDFKIEEFAQELLIERQLSDSPNNPSKPKMHLIFTTPPPPPVLNLSSFIPQKELNKGWGEIFKNINADIPEDSIYRKLLACIPIIGIIPTVRNEHSLRKKITQTKEPKFLVKLISVKNHYKISSIIRELLSLALIVTGMALTILNWPIGIGAGIIVGSCVVFNAYGIYKNKQIINKLQANDLPT